jgi:multidrug resistance protein MdtO
MTIPIWEFLRREFAPTPGRWQATLRITLACLACTIPIMAFHLKQPVMVMIGMFMLTREDISTTLLGTLLATFAAIVSCGLLLLYYMVALDLVWLRVLSVPLLIMLGLLMIRVVNPPILGLGVAICVGFGITIPDTVSNIETLNRTPFYYCWAWILGLSVNLAVQYLLNPEHSQSVLLRGLTTRLEAVEKLLRRLAAGEPAEVPPSSLAPLALAGVTGPLQLLNLAGAVEPWLKRYKAELRAQYIVVDRLVTAAAALEAQGLPPPNEAVRQRLGNLADACARWRTAITNHAPPEIPGPTVAPTPALAGQEALPSLAEMERAAELMPFTFPGRELPPELKSSPNQDQGGFLAADAFSNPEHLHFAIKGALAAFICYLIYTMSAYPAIYTCVITCILCSLSTVGASVQKGILRFAGSAVGGALGFLSLMYVFPNVDSLGGFWLPFGAVMALAAYVNFGSPRISYCGIQICLAFCKCAMQTYGTYTEVRVARDRLIGIALGLLVFGTINSRLWPVTALGTMRAKLASVLRTLAQLARLPDESDHAPQLTEAYGLRLRVYQDFGTVRELLESSKFESGAERREQLEAIRDGAQTLFLHQLAIIQHRSDLRPSSVPEPLRAESLRFRKTLATVLDNLSDRVQGKPERLMPDLKSAMADLEQTVAAQINTVTDAGVAAQIRARLALYQAAVPIATKLSRLGVG